MEIKTSRLILRDFKSSDLNFYIELETNKDCLMYEQEKSYPIDSIRSNFNTILQNQTKQRDKYSFVIEENENHISVGRIVIWKIDESISEWEIGWILHPQYWGKGYASEAAQALINNVFTNHNAHRIQALCHEHNVQSESVMIRIGMKKEGVLRAVRYLNNQWAGSIIYSILDTD